MKNVLALVKDRIITGFIVIVPIAVIGIILADTFKKLIAFTAPLTGNMQYGGVVLKAVVAILLLITLLGLFLFVCGFILKTYFGNKFKKWLEQTVLEHVPFFKTMNSVVHQITGIEKGKYPVVEVSLYGNGNKMLGIRTDTLADGRSVVYIPFSPLVNFGQTHLISKENVQLLDITLKEFVDIISKIGLESKDLLKEKGNTMGATG